MYPFAMFLILLIEQCAEKSDFQIESFIAAVPPSDLCGSHSPGFPHLITIVAQSPLNLHFPSAQLHQVLPPESGSKLSASSPPNDNPLKNN